MSKVIAVIPARLGSSRFPGKILHDFHGKPLIYYVYQSLQKSKMIDRIIIATDNRQIKIAVEQFGAEVVNTSKKHQTGSDRVAEVADQVKADIYLNVQGDNFGISAKTLDTVIRKFSALKKVSFGTLGVRINDDIELFNPDNVKVLINSENKAIYFSRFPLPYLQNCSEDSRTTQFPFYKHIGIYFFRANGLKKFAGWSRSPLEKAESLEQLRILDNNESIYMFKTRMRTVSVDSKNDLEKLESLYT